MLNSYYYRPHAHHLARLDPSIKGGSAWLWGANNRRNPNGKEYDLSVEATRLVLLGLADKE